MLLNTKNTNYDAVIRASANEKVRLRPDLPIDQAD